MNSAHSFLFLVFLPLSAARWYAPLEESVMSVSQHCPGQNVHHLEWCTKYRFKALKREEFYNACEASIRHAAERHEIQVLELGVMSDHVHALVQLPSMMSVARAVMLLKGCSAYDLFRFEPKFRLLYRRGHFWGRSYYHASAGDASVETVSRYVREENDPHQTRLA